MAEHTIKPCGEAVTLAGCPPGLFLFRGDGYESLGFKSEYKTETSSSWQSDAYCVDSGEYFWGGAKSGAEREQLMVIPMEANRGVAE